MQETQKNKTSSDALIVFLKNKMVGKVKTRLAKDTNPTFALEVYSHLREYTLQIAQGCNCDVYIYFSDYKEDVKWANDCLVQEGNDLGERMSNAFRDCFAQGYKKTLLVGSDCDEITLTDIEEGFSRLRNKEVVLGPAKDGGYYLVGMKKLQNDMFRGIDWSTNKVLSQTLNKLNQADTYLLKEYNDIDNLEDLKASRLWAKFSEYLS